MFEPLFSSLFSSLFSPLIAPAQRIFITLDGGHYTLANTIVEEDEFRLEFNFASSATTNQGILGTDLPTSDDVTLRSDGKMRIVVGANTLTFNTVVNDGKAHNYVIVRDNLNLTTGFLDSVPDGSMTMPGDFEVSTIGTEDTNFFDGTLYDINLGNGNAWQLNRLTGNTEQAAGGGNDLTYVNIPEGAPDRELFTKNTSTDPDQWENADKSRIIEIA